MPRPTVDYMNARRDAGKGGHARADRLAVARPAGDVFEQVAERLAAFYRDQRQIVAEFRRQQTGCNDAF